MTPEQEERRGLGAQAILDNALYREAFDTIQARIVSQLMLADTPDERRKRLNDLLIALAKVDGYLRQVMVSGTMAAMEIERQRTIRERITDRVKRFA